MISCQVIFRWSSNVDCDHQQARERLQHYFEAIGYRCVQREPELMMRRGSLWHGFVSASPRRILTGVVAYTQPWGDQTLVDVDFYIFQRGRSWHELDAELLVQEAREMMHYLEEGDADFERLRQIDRRAVRTAWRATILSLATIAAIVLVIGIVLTALRTTMPISPIAGGAIGGLIAWLLFSALSRRRR